MEKNKQDGNKCFTQKRFFEALDFYNKGIKTVSSDVTSHLSAQTKELLLKSRYGGTHDISPEGSRPPVG